MAMPIMISSNNPTSITPGIKGHFLVCAHQPEFVNLSNSKTSNHTSLFSQPLSNNPLHLHIGTPERSHSNNTNWSSVNGDKDSLPVMSPKEVISDAWREIHGAADWHDLLEPLHPWLRREIVKYGEFAQATYDAFDFDPSSEYCGSCRYNHSKFFEQLGLSKHGYKVCKYVYAMSHVGVPPWLERSHLVDTWSKDSNWMGFVAISDDEETRRIGRRDIVVVWRGTVAPSEWYNDFQRKLEPVGNGDAKVEHGFHTIYTSKSDSTRYNKSSASEQVMKEVKRLVQLYKDSGEEVSLTITGHSLGGALALLNAHEAGTSLPGLPISVISFGAPRVGNIAFRDELKRGLNLTGFHCLETYLHLVDGFLSSGSAFRPDAKRDVALVNKACDMLVDEPRIPHCFAMLLNSLSIISHAHFLYNCRHLTP